MSLRSTIAAVHGFKVWLIIIFGFLFTIGNVTWHLFNEYRVFYVPLAVFLFLLLWQVKRPVKTTKLQDYFLTYFIFLSLSNIVKQVLWIPEIDQINDYIIGGIATLILLIFLIKWMIQKHKNGGKA